MKVHVAVPREVRAVEEAEAVRRTVRNEVSGAQPARHCAPGEGDVSKRLNK